MSELIRAISTFLSRPKDVVRSFLTAPNVFSGLEFTVTDVSSGAFAAAPNRLREYFLDHKEGHGIWKWDVYFDAYDAAMRKFVNTDVTLMEIGVFSGGSIDMWREYLGGRSRIFGLDIEPTCKVYENDYTRILVGDQSDRVFLARCMDEIGELHIVVDDGSHVAAHQIASFEEIFPRMAPGGVYICEDIHGKHDRFTDYVSGLTKAMYDMRPSSNKMRVPTNSIQRWVQSIRIYPYMLVVEKRQTPLDTLAIDKQGTIWQPFTPKAKSS